MKPSIAFTKDTIAESVIERCISTIPNILRISFYACLLILLSGTKGKSQTTLLPGDLAFISYNADGGTEDNFSFVLLKDIEINTEIFFTDLGWTGTQFQNASTNCGGVSDGIIKWTANSALSCGSEVYIFATTNFSTNSGTVSGVQATFNDATKYINLSGGGDQVLAYQGTKVNPNFVAGIYMNTPAWDPPTSPCEFTSGKSALPATLISYGFTIQPEVDNAEYLCTPNSGSVNALRTAISNPSNWGQNNTTQFPLPVNCNFICTQNGPEVTLQPMDANVCPNFAANFSVTATNTTGYQWEVNTGGGFVNASSGIYSGANTANLTVDPITGLSGAQFRCQLTGAGGNSTSNAATLTEIFPPTITQQPTDAVSCVGCTSGFSVLATGENIIYQWKVSTGAAFTNIVDNANYQGANTAKLQINNIPVGLDGAMYKCEISGTCLPLVETNTKTLDLSGSSTTLVAGDLAFIAYNVDDALETQEDNFSFVLLEDIGGGSEINITDFGWANNNAFHGTCDGTFSATDGIIKWVATSDLTCGSEIFINGKTSLSTNTGIVFGVQSTASNASEYLPFSGSGDQLFAYQGTHASPTLLTGMYFANDAGWDASFIECGVVGEETSSTKSILPTALLNGFSAIAVTDVLGSEVDNAKYNCTTTTGETASIRAAIMTVSNWTTDDTNPFPLPVNCGIGCNESAPNITSQPVSVTLCSGLSTSFSITAVNVTGYQWQINTTGTWNNLTDNAIYNGATTNTLNISNSNGLDNPSYRCIASNSMGNSTSQAADLNLVFPPTIVDQPVDAVSCAGCSTGFYANVIGDNLNYQWQVSSNGGATFNNLFNDAVYSGVQTNVLRLTAVGSGLNGYLFRCQISGTCTPTQITAIVSLDLNGQNQNLAAGDLAFVSFNADADQDNFSFVLLTPITGGTEINITDFGWTDANAFQNCAGTGSSDGIIKWVANENFDCGTEIMIEGKTKLIATKGIVFGTQATVADTNNYINISGSGDQLFAYQGSFNSPTLLTGIYNSSSTGWDASLPACEVTNTKSILPPGLITGFSAIQIAPELDNAKYDCSVNITNADPTTLRTALLDPSNWIGNNDMPFTDPLDCSFACCATTNSTTLYVDIQATGAKDGQSWAGAFSSLQDAFSSARSCGVPASIKIAGGTYYPDEGALVSQGDRNATFTIDFITDIEGGYDASTGLIDYTSPTILSGNISNKIDISDNSYRVVTISEMATLSNLTIEGAYNDLPATFQGGGIFATAGIFKNIILRYNYNFNSNGIGAGMYVTGDAIEMENVLIYKNESGSYGGGISIENTSGTNVLKNVTIADNISSNNGGLDNFNATIIMHNSIVFHNLPDGINIFGTTTLSANNSIIETASVWPGTGNSNFEPKFINKASENYRISECWVAYNRGNNADAPASNIDLDGNPRVKQDNVDIGAYEVQRAEVRTQIPELEDQSLVYSCPKKVKLGIPNATNNVIYSFFSPNFDGSVVGNGTDIILTSIADATPGSYTLQGSRGGYNKLTFGANKRITIPYDPALALRADEDFTIECGFNLDNIIGIKRIYSQEGSIGIGFANSNLIITRYAEIDVYTTGVDVTAGTDHILKIEQKVIGPDLVRLIVSLDGIVKWTDTRDMAFNPNSSPINIGGRPISQWMEGTMDFLQINKGNKVALRYDFVTGGSSNTVFDYRLLEDGETPRNGTMIGFTPATDWVVGLEPNLNLCHVFANIDVDTSDIPVNHTVKNVDVTGFESLRYLTVESCPNDTIRFDPILNGQTHLIPSFINIPHDLNFVGNGMTSTVWDGNNSGMAIFGIPASAKILMKDLQITKANESVIGSFYVSGDHTFENVLFEGYDTNSQVPFRLDGLSKLIIKGILRIK